MADDPTFLSIPDSLGRDLDNGKCDNMDMSEFMSDSQLEQIQEATADYNGSSRAPVHMDSLTPISKARAAEMTRFDGEHLPKAPATRRVIPKPFQRDRVSGGRHGKTWREIDATRIYPGDIITDLGLVVRVEHKIRHQEKQFQHTHLDSVLVEGCPGCYPVAVGTDVVAYGKGGAVHTYDEHALVNVFRKH